MLDPLCSVLCFAIIAESSVPTGIGVLGGLGGSAVLAWAVHQFISGGIYPASTVRDLQKANEKLQEANEKWQERYHELAAMNKKMAENLELMVELFKFVTRREV